MWFTAVNKVRSCSMVSPAQNQIKRRELIQCGPEKENINAKGKGYKIRHCISKFSLLFRQWRPRWVGWKATRLWRLVQLTEQESQTPPSACPPLPAAPGYHLLISCCVPVKHQPPRPFSDGEPSRDGGRKKRWDQYTTSLTLLFCRREKETDDSVWEMMEGKANVMFSRWWCPDYM